MPVHHHQAMVATVAEKILANPSQVARLLAVFGDAGADAGMNEQIVADADAIHAARQKGLMLSRNERRQALGQFCKTQAIIRIA